MKTLQDIYNYIGVNLYRLDKNNNKYYVTSIYSSSQYNTSEVIPIDIAKQLRNEFLLHTLTLFTGDDILKLIIKQRNNKLDKIHSLSEYRKIL